VTKILHDIKRMLWLIIPVVIVVVIIVIVMMKSPSKSSSKSPPSKSPSDSNGNGKTVLQITGDGAYVESYRMPTGRREHYLIIPDVTACGGKDRPQWCEDMNYESSYGMAYIYDEQLGPNVEQDVPCSGEVVCEKKPNTCPDGGYACTFFERYNDDGDLVAITNAAGENMLDKMATDAWAGKWEEWSFAKMVKNEVEYRDGKMFFTKDDPSGDLKAGDELNLKRALSKGVPTMYFIALLVFMSEAGEAKPDEIVLDVKGARQGFKARVGNSRPRGKDKKDKKEAVAQEDKKDNRELVRQKKKVTYEDYDGLELGKKYKIGVHESPHVGRDINYTWCKKSGSKITCEHEENDSVRGERQYFSFVEQRDNRYNLTDYNNWPCSAYDDGEILCKDPEEDSDPDVYKLTRFPKTSPTFKLLNETKNKYCVAKRLNNSWDFRLVCDQDTFNKGDTFRHN